MVPQFRRSLKLPITALILLLIVVIHKEFQQHLERKNTGVLIDKELGFNFKNEPIFTTSTYMPLVQNTTIVVRSKQNTLATEDSKVSNSSKKQERERESIWNRNVTEEYERFFRPKNKINPFKYDFVINGSAICNKTIPFLIVLIPSIPKNIGVRNGIRNTWGSLAYGGLWPGKSMDVKVKLAFLLAISQPNNKTLTKLINQESEKYGDIVEGNFKDSYYNLTLKILLGLKWVTLYCNKASFVVKADEDIFVNLPFLVNSLKQKYVGPDGKIFGYLNLKSKVPRYGRWRMDKSLYPFPYFPRYVSGGSYFLSTNVVARLLQASEFFPYIFIEDVFITGILAKKVNAIVDLLPGVTYWGDKSAVPCDFVLNKRISKRVYDLKKMYYVWKEMHSKTLNCYR